MQWECGSGFSIIKKSPTTAVYSFIPIYLIFLSVCVRACDIQIELLSVAKCLCRAQRMTIWYCIVNDT